MPRRKAVEMRLRLLLQSVNREGGGLRQEVRLLRSTKGSIVEPMLLARVLQ